jgi:putative ABC transport system permease protein
MTRPAASRVPHLGALWEAMQQGFAALTAYKLRAALTILGVVMGIMTVTGMSAIVAGLNASMAQQIQSLGSSVVFVRPWGPGENLSSEQRRKRRGLSLDEIERLGERPEVRAIAALEPVFADVVKYGSQKLQNPTIFGATPAYETVHDVYVSKGRFLVGSDVDRAAKVVVLGADIADALFPHVDPLDKEIFIDGRRFVVVGVMERMGKFLFISRDNFMLVPVGAVQKKDPRFNFLVADVKPRSPELIDDTVEQLRLALRQARRLRYEDEDNFTVFTQDTFTDLYRQLTGGIYLVMIAISSIGLLVGGVGVMNIMLVSVTERTREIGVRKALGARRRDLLSQFLTEAVTLTGLGGVLGILIGGGLAALINAFSPFPALVQPTWVLIAFFTSVAVGLIFGLWPAAKAAGLDPIEALRYE